MKTTHGNSRSVEKERLVVGVGQAIFEPRDGRVHVAMCHHPDEWILDADEIRKRLDKHALVHVTGHTHDYDVKETDAGVWLRAGALQPSRREKCWRPHFSVLEIVEADAEIKVTVYPWAWSSDDLEFAAGDARTVRRSTPSTALSVARQDEVADATAVRRLNVRLGLLSSGDVLSAAVEAGLPSLAGTLDDAPGTLAAQAVDQAQEAGRLRELWDRMAARRNKKMENPFQ